MILTPHILVGAAIASKIPNIWGLILALLSHFVLDAIPHYEYSIKGIRKVKKKQFLRDVTKVQVDFCLGLFLFSIFAVNLSPISAIYGLIGIVAALTPDGLLFFYYISERKYLKKFGRFNSFVHYFKRKYKTRQKPSSLNVSTQILAAIIAIIILII